ncbi:hypothetical protein BU15DRAFT_88852 [Melanogaster broomeanus]|nr:hypothetical protein BU15DRAFT_88852 [Melanogaster broomeanus]
MTTFVCSELLFETVCCSSAIGGGASVYPLSVLSSPTPSASNRHSDSGQPYSRTRSQPDFEIERPAKTPSGMAKRPSARRLQSDYGAEHALRASVSRLLSAKARPFTASGRITIDPTALVLFFRSKSAITHSLDFPIDIDYDTPPALDVLIAACRPHQTAGINVYPDRDSLYYPPNLPLTATLEIANHPILEAVRNALFPNLPIGHYLITTRDRLEVMVRVATICVTLPVQYRGGALIIRDAEVAEREWTAFLADCEYEVETVQQGCRMSISFAVHLKTYGPAVDPLITPSESFLDLLSPVLSLSRGRKVAFYLTQEYGVNPAEVLAESMVPHLKGSDSLLYHALKVYKLAPELHWAAGGYIWPIDRAVECGSDGPDSPTTAALLSFAAGYNSPSKRSLPMRPMSYYEIMKVEADLMRLRVEEGGAVSLAEAEIFILSDWARGPRTKEKVYFSSNGELEKLVVNVLLVTYVP